MLDTSELFKANFRNMESLKKINILNDLSKVNFGFKETTNGINEAFKKINILNDLSKVNFGFKETTNGIMKPSKRLIYSMIFLKLILDLKKTQTESMNL